MWIVCLVYIVYAQCHWNVSVHHQNHQPSTIIFQHFIASVVCVLGFGSGFYFECLPFSTKSTPSTFNHIQRIILCLLYAPFISSSGFVRKIWIDDNNESIGRLWSLSQYEQRMFFCCYIWFVRWIRSDKKITNRPITILSPKATKHKAQVVLYHNVPFVVVFLLSIEL